MYSQFIAQKFDFISTYGIELIHPIHYIPMCPKIKSKKWVFYTMGIQMIKFKLYFCFAQVVLGQIHLNVQ